MRRLILVVGLVLMFGDPAAADLQSAFAHFERGDYEAAQSEFSKLAEQGDARAQYYLGIIYLNGFAEPPSPTAASDLIRRAAEQDYLQAQTELGRMYRIGDSVPQDYVEMVKWYGKAAEQGDVGAQLFLADSYAYGFGVEPDYVQAYMWYEIAIQYWGPLAVRARDVIAEKMSTEQISEAVQLAGQWLKDMRR